jgi:hypothetical protein
MISLGAIKMAKRKRENIPGDGPDPKWGVIAAIVQAIVAAIDLGMKLRSR